jgi:hypothetical protein
LPGFHTLAECNLTAPMRQPVQDFAVCVAVFFQEMLNQQGNILGPFGEAGDAYFNGAQKCFGRLGGKFRTGTVVSKANPRGCSPLHLGPRPRHCIRSAINRCTDSGERGRACSSTTRIDPRASRVPTSITGYAIG